MPLFSSKQSDILENSKPKNQERNDRNANKLDRVRRKIYIDRVRGNQAGNRIPEGLAQRTAQKNGKGDVRKGFMTLSYQKNDDK